MSEPGRLTERVLALVTALRDNGIRVATQESQDAMRALSLLGEAAFAEREVLAATLRTSLIKRADDEAVFDRVFALHLGAARVEDPLLSRQLEEALKARGMDAAEAAELAARLGDGAGELARALLDGDAHAIADLVRAALDDTDTQGLKTPLQIGYFAHRLMTRLGIEELEQFLRRGVAALAEGEGDPALRGAIDERLLALRRLARASVRQEYDKRHATRDREGSPADLLERPFHALDPFEVERMRRIVRRIAERLKARVKRRERRRRHGRLDARRTSRASLASDGVPLRMIFRRRRRDRPDLLVLCDVSDSVRSASLFMLQFVYSLTELFRRVRGFVFVDRLGEVTELFQREPLDDAIAAVHEGRVVSVFANSDYGRALRELAAGHLESVTRRTTVVILGDGRTNYRPDEAWIVAALRRRARAVLWLCPEAMGTWGFGDSRMPAYARAATRSFEARNLAQLARVVDQLPT